MIPSKQFESMDVSTWDGLQSLGERLYDECFDVDTMCYDEQTCTVDIPFLRIWHGGPRRVVKNRLIYRVEEVDVLRCSLRFLDVVRYTLQDPERIGAYTFEGFRRDEGQGLVAIHGSPNCIVMLAVGRIWAEYREIGFRGKSRITQGYFWDANSSAVYDD